MNAGRAEQVGTPMEVYEDPATQFVAGFIGSPSMNFLGAKAQGNGNVALDRGGVVRHVNGGAEVGRPVTVGIRPEHLEPCDPQRAQFSATVEMVELLGADALVHMGRHGEQLTARLPHGARPESGATLHLAVDPARVYLFDATSGARLR
jgi:sn-glycerol 3-phosphate transport system ATP-binding protein